MDISLCERMLYPMASPLLNLAVTKCANRIQLVKLMGPTDGIHCIGVLAGSANYNDVVDAKESLYRLGKLCLQLWSFVTRWKCKKLYLKTCSLNDDVAPCYSLDIAVRNRQPAACETFLLYLPSCGIELPENVFKLRIQTNLTLTYQPKNLHGSLPRQAYVEEMQGTTSDTIVIDYDDSEATKWASIAVDPKRVHVMISRGTKTLASLP